MLPAKLELAPHIPSFALSMSWNILWVLLMGSDFFQASLPQEHLYPFISNTLLIYINLFHLTKLLWLPVWSLSKYSSDSLAMFNCFFINYSNEQFQIYSNCITVHCLTAILLILSINVSSLIVSRRQKQHEIYIISSAKYKIYQ